MKRSIGMWKNICSLLLVFVLFACDEPADLANSQSYEKDGVSFILPGNWKVVGEEREEGFRYIDIATSTDAVAGISVFSNGAMFNLEDYVNLIIDSFNDLLPVGSRDRGDIVEFEVDQTDKVEKALRNQFSITLADVEVPHTADFYEMKVQSDRVIIFTQTTNEEKELVQKGFDQLIQSFKQD
ncbi:hypothetical protein WH95_01160 [Kiloniella litopenaei]|uniref:PsbP C-terminal domain-containing protein n=1 Tax=Kiloniella litopenaei TaxID=1549748 RepID=A0A0M2RE62_9PROT|nr:hypothetical protein [Kiloniella litopenaei]KKJ78719.1 hypothetical protein WH95_01160 [Kiloniella litopenaei]